MPTPPRVLVIDDNHDDADGLKTLLELWGYEAHAVYSGITGMWDAQFWRPDIVLVDVRLPGALDGLAVARMLQREPTTNGSRLIAITGYADDKVLEQAEESGVERVLTKPVDPSTLEGLLRPAV
jgi:CheY-like chemotaxis protein